MNRRALLAGLFSAPVAAAAAVPGALASGGVYTGGLVYVGECGPELLMSGIEVKVVEAVRQTLPSMILQVERHMAPRDYRGR